MICERCGKQSESIVVMGNAERSAQYSAMAGGPYYEYDHICPSCVLETLGLHQSEPNPRETLLSDISKQKALMIEVATGGSRIQEKDDEYRNRRLSIATRLRQIGMADPNPYSDLWSWYGKWSSGDLPSYQSRRQYIGQLYDPLITKIERLASTVPADAKTGPTGWARVDRGIDAIRETLETARNEEQFQTVGLLCRETIISLAQAVYDPEKHKIETDVAISKTDANRMLEVYFATEIAGSSNEASRKHARASLALANELQHRRTATFRDAALCNEATRSVVNIVAIISGIRNPSDE